MKILFYDIRDFELNYLLEKVSDNLEPIFMKCPLNETTYVDEKYLDAQAVSVFVSSSLNREVLSKFKNLKFIFLRCVGYSNVDLEYCKENDIYVFNTPNYGNSTVGEFVFSLILSLGRKISDAKESLIKGAPDHDELMGFELNSKTIGVIGAGAIGRRVINIAYGFQMNVLVYDIEQKGAYDFVELDELLEKSDIISINCPLTPSTRGLINKETISKMKKDAVLINTARGEIIDTQALYQALVDKKIKGAALDVVECEEALCQNYDKCQVYADLKADCIKKFFFVRKLMQMPNVLITPHIAYNTREAQIRILDMTLENIYSTFDINPGVKNLVLI